MNKVAVLGFGNFGTALAQQLAKTQDLVLAWTNEAEIVTGVNQQHRNPVYLKDVHLSPKIKVTDKLTDLQDFQTIVVALPAMALSPVFSELIPAANCLLISATKGLDHKSNKTPLQCANSFYANHCRYAVLSGPGFAKDIAAGKPAGLVAAAVEAADAQHVAEIFSAEHLRVYTSNDTTGVELGGIVKNVIAIAAGISDGLNLGDSARAGIITRGFSEMLRLALTLGAKSETLMGLSGIGDLVLTATCDASRNRTIGLRLGAGENLTAIVDSLGSVAEGVMTTKLVLNLAAEKNIDMPISKQVFMVLESAISPRQMLDNLMARPLVKEW